MFLVNKERELLNSPPQVLIYLWNIQSLRILIIQSSMYEQIKLAL